MHSATVPSDGDVLGGDSIRFSDLDISQPGSKGGISAGTPRRGIKRRVGAWQGNPNKAVVLVCHE